ncbi:MutS2 family protein [Cytobacillus oceanisediminis]|uniref:MutS2 family protein n=1 Tax=Cytobacillus oceanisediminis TaxID=665099 RepID=A0A2V2ZXF1_9BACI|nr:DNA mismatch repair protein [Cytobacillus oceanisediminis]PWW25913.1 MutS2 family protein [Cytobacillus oceanisediminis]
MNTNTFTLLDYDIIKERVSQFALSEAGKKKLFGMVPSENLKQIKSWLDETEEAVKILEKSASIPVHGLEGIESVLNNFNKGIALRPEQLMKLYDFLDCCRKIRRFMKDKEVLAPRVASYIHSIEELPALAEEIIRCIRNGRVDDYASKALLKVRKQISIQEERLKEKLQQLIKSSKYKNYLQEMVISQRGGRYVIPVKKEYKNKIKGHVLDTSASGSTYFIEPVEIGDFQEQLNWLIAEEEAEVQQVLLFLTGLVEANEKEIKIAVETMIHYDVLFAKAKYARSIEAQKPDLNESHHIKLICAKHPLLGRGSVPLTLELGSNGQHALVITGPNTGGKTVTIKTVGLLTLMAQSGMLLPVQKGSSIAIFQQVLLDIGDGQSIEDNLSTFSSRIKNIIEILQETNDRTLVLLDELGSGTDPAEGMGLATAIMEQMYKKGPTIIATTHYNEIKGFAEEHEGFLNGAMEFDLDTLQPTYKLIIGKGGESQAFAIALKLGMHPKIIERAHQITYKEERTYLPYSNEHKSKIELEKQIIVNRHIKRSQEEKKQDQAIQVLKQGDNVLVSPQNEIGIIHKGPDARGNFSVQIKGEKVIINHKRLKLYISANELYPEDYDFDIIFETKENRKKSKLINRKHVEGLIIESEEQN